MNGHLIRRCPALRSRSVCSVRSATLLLVFNALLVYSIHARAQGRFVAEPPDPALISQPAFDRDTVIGLLGWAARVTGRALPAGLVLPSLRAVSTQQINGTVCPDRPTRCRSWAAAYGIERGDIIFRDTLNQIRLMDRSYIVHELVHFLQHREQGHAVNASCQTILANEREAYLVQAKYLNRHGMRYSLNMLSRLGTCPPVEEVAGL